MLFLASLAFAVISIYQNSMLVKVVEQTRVDQQHAISGVSRETMHSVLNEEHGAAPGRILKHVRKGVDAFVQDAEQFDDLTMLCLEYRGPEKEEKDPAVQA